MARKALCVGINDYPLDDSDLRGCVNDAHAWASLLTDHYDFASPDVQLLLDGDATKAGILDGLGNLLHGAAAGDVLVFTNSSHGTYLLDRGGDEDKYDQALCPHDIDASLILDDELRVLFADVPREVHLAVILDNCHSGSGTREVRQDEDDDSKPRKRFLDPARRGDPVLDEDEEPPTPAGAIPESVMNEILLSGCLATESSWDAPFGDAWQGAMTFHALKVIRQARFDLTYAELHDRLSNSLRATSFQQHPQLEGRDDNKNRPLFR
jgi:hypothetical protein